MKTDLYKTEAKFKNLLQQTGRDEVNNIGNFYRNHITSTMGVHHYTASLFHLLLPSDSCMQHVT